MKSVQQNKKSVAAKAPKQKSPLKMKTGRSNMVMAPSAISQSLQSYFNVSSIKNHRYGSAIRIQGQDFLSAVKTPGASDVPGKVLAELYLNPLEFGDSRMAQFATLYEKFLFRRFKLKWVPATGTQTSGSVVMAFDRDIYDDTPPPSDAGLRRMCSWLGSKQFPVWEPQSIDCKLEQPDTGYYTSQNGNDDRLSYQGQLYVASVVPASVAAFTTIGSLWIEYDLEMFVPQLENSQILNKYEYPVGSSYFPDATDALKPLSVNQGPSATNTPGVVILPPDPGGPTRLKLPEGLFEVVYTLSQAVAGGVTFGNSILNAVTPEPAPAPQPALKSGGVSSANASGNVAMLRQLINVPRGGATWTPTTTLASGIGSGTSVARLFVTKLGPVLASAAFSDLYA